MPICSIMQDNLLPYFTTFECTMGDDKLSFAIAIFENDSIMAASDPADSSTFERGSINETDPYDIYYNQVLNDMEDNRTLFDNSTTEIIVRVHCRRSRRHPHDHYYDVNETLWEEYIGHHGRCDD